MCEKKYSKVFKGLERREVWSLLTDIEAWPSWHEDLEFCTLEGEFKEGSFFWLKPKGMKAFKILLTEIQEGSSFTDCTFFPFAKMYDTHKVEETPAGLRVSNELRMKGPLKHLWYFLVGRHVAASVPEELEVLARLLEKKSGEERKSI